MKRCKGIQDQSDQMQGGQNMRRSDGARLVRQQSAEGVLLALWIGGALGKKIGQEKAFGRVQRGQIQKGAGQSGAVSGAMHGLFGLGDGTDLQLLQMGAMRGRSRYRPAGSVPVRAVPSAPAAGKMPAAMRERHLVRQGWGPARPRPRAHSPAG